MLFQKRQDFTPARMITALGQSDSCEITREFHIESLILQLNFTSAANIATATADGLLGLLKRVVITIADGAATRSVVDCSGRGLLELHNQIVGNLDRNTLAAKDVTATGTNVYQINYPIWFALPQVADPVGSAFLLPAPRFNSNIIVTITIASQADIDSNGNPTFTVPTGFTWRVIVNRRQVNTINFGTFDTELAELSANYATTGANQLYEFQSLGSYTGILLRCYTSATARGDVSIANGVFTLQAVGSVLRRFRLTDLQCANDYSNPVAPAGCETAAGGSVASQFAGAYYMDFLTDRVGDVSEMGSVLNTNPLAGSGARVQLLQDITGGAGVQIKYLTHRVFGDLSTLKLTK